MGNILLIGLGLFLLAGLALVVIGWMRSRQPDTVLDRLEEFGALERAPTLEEIELAQPFTDRVAVPLLRGLAQFAMRLRPRESMEATQHKLDLAGNPYRWGPGEFLGVRVLAALLLGGLGIVLLVTSTSMSVPRRIMLAGAMAGLGYYLPVLWLGSKIRRRQQEIVKALPDALDLLTICVEAGLGFDGAMARVAAKWDNELSTAFTRTMQEVQLGKLRREALRDMSNRMEVQDMGTFVAAIIQAEQLGVSIARVLRIQSEQMRVRRRQRAEEEARKAPVKILPPIAFLIFPAIFVVLLGPAVIQMMTMENPLFGGGGLALP